MTRMWGRPRAAVVSLALASALSACGSTAQVGAAGGAGLPAADGLGGPAAASDPITGVPVPGVPQAGGGSTQGSVGGGATDPAPEGPNTRAGAAQAPGETPADGGQVPIAGAPGVTATTIKFGASYTTDSGEANAALGAGGLDQGDARKYYNAMIKQINGTGGVAGRRLVPSYFEVKTTTTASAASVEQAACEKWTKDDRVFAVVGEASEILRSCAEKNGLINLYSGASNSIASTFQRYPHYVEVSAMALDRASQATAEGLAKTDYFGAKPVIGVVAWDHPSYRTSVTKSLIPTLKRLGYAVAEQAYVKVAESNAGVSDSSAGASSAVLQFRSAGVGHVLIVDGPAGVFGGTGLTLLFVKAAGSQRYYPRYGLNESNSAESGRQAGLWSADDMRGARAVTWGNVLDESDTGAPANTRRKQCLDLMRREGVQIANINARIFALRACDYLWYLREVLGANMKTVSRPAFLAGVHRVGTSYASPLLYGTRFSPTQHDGVGQLRLMKLDDACGCFVYSSAPYPAPGS